MLSLIRSGPQMLIMESGVVAKLKQYFEERFVSTVCTLGEAFEKSSEEYTIILIVENSREIVHLDDIRHVFLIKEDSDVILCSLHNDGKCNLLKHSRIAPRILVMRALGDVEKVITEIRKDHQASSGPLLEMLDNHNSLGTILVFTEQPLNKKISSRDLYPQTLFIAEKQAALERRIRIHGLKYLNEGLGNKDWYELEIKIYDIYEEYLLHYQRLLKVIEFLELGIILGESWGRDTTLIFNSIGIYRLRFFTFYEPAAIKKLLIGLEYLDDGTRIVDYDVFYKRKKLYWSDIGENLKSKSRVSRKHRELILAKLDENQTAEIFELERKILATRD
ncbi:MAG: hypothetical protein ACOWWO_16925 [Peptococcaceae bacterium]